MYDISIHYVCFEVSFRRQTFLISIEIVITFLQSTFDQYYSHENREPWNVPPRIWFCHSRYGAHLKFFQQGVVTKKKHKSNRVKQSTNSGKRAEAQKAVDRTRNFSYVHTRAVVVAAGVAVGCRPFPPTAVAVESKAEDRTFTGKFPAFLCAAVSRSFPPPRQTVA